MQKEIDDLEKTLHYTYDVVNEGIWDWDANSGDVYRSPAWYRMLEYDLNALPQTVLTWEELIHPEDYLKVMSHFEAYINKQSDCYKIEYRCLTGLNDYRWIEDSAKVVEWNEDGTVKRMIGAHHDIHEEKIAIISLEAQNDSLRLNNALLEEKLEEITKELETTHEQLEEKIKEIQHIANTDHLTGLYCREHFEKVLKKEMGRAKRYQYSLSLVMFDIDFFKKINDEWGYPSGDHVLKALGKRLSTQLRESDVVARWDGEEFMILFPNTTLDNAVDSVIKIQTMLASKPLYKKVMITCSFGVIEIDNYESVATVIHQADQLMQEAKAKGRNCIVH